MGDRAEWVCPVLADVGMHEPLPRQRIVVRARLSVVPLRLKWRTGSAPEYNRVPHICPVLADVGFHEPLRATVSCQGTTFSRAVTAQMKNGLQPLSTTGCPISARFLADVGFPRTSPRNRIVSGHDFQSCVTAQMKEGLQPLSTVRHPISRNLQPVTYNPIRNL